MPHRQSFIIDHVHEETGKPEKVRVVRWESFERWRKRAAKAFVGLALVSSAGLYLTIEAQSEFAAEVESRVELACLDRANTRISVAVGLDELRRSAVVPPARPTVMEQAQFEHFIERTQTPIDRLLTEAATATVKTKGELVPENIDTVRKLAAQSCARLAASFDSAAGD